MKRHEVFFVWCVIFILGFGVVARAGSMDKIAAIVNDDIITEAELILFASMTDIEDTEEMSDEDARNFRKKLLQRMVEDRLVLQEAKKMNLIVNDRLVEGRIEEIREKAGSPGAFDLALEQQGITLNELREKLKNQLLVYLAIEHAVTNTIKISPKDVTDYYNKHKDQFMALESAQVDSIFVEDKSILDQVHEELNAGKDFNELSKKYSKKANVGLIKRGQLKKELDDFIFGLKERQCSLPFEFDNGYYLFLVREKNDAKEKSIEEVRAQIFTMLENAKTERKLKEWIEELKERAYISIRE